MHDRNSKEVCTPEEVIKKKRKRLEQKNDIISFFEKLILFLVLIWLLFGVFFGLNAMPNDDMKPSIKAGDVLIYYRLENTWRADDVIVFEKDNVQYTGRIVAVGGDKVEIDDDGTIKINDSVVGEDDIYYTTKPYDGGIAFPVTLQGDECFVLCDEREGAKDSRFFGPVKMSEIKGKVITILRRSEI